MKSPHSSPQNLSSTVKGLSGRFISTTVSTFFGFSSQKRAISFLSVVPVSNISSTMRTCLPTKSQGKSWGSSVISPVERRPEQDLTLMKWLVWVCLRSLTRSEQNMKAPLSMQTTTSSKVPCYCLIWLQYSLICCASLETVCWMAYWSQRSANYSPLWNFVDIKQLIDCQQPYTTPDSLFHYQPTRIRSIPHSLAYSTNCSVLRAATKKHSQKNQVSKCVVKKATQFEHITIILVLQGDLIDNAQAEYPNRLAKSKLQFNPAQKSSYTLHTLELVQACRHSDDEQLAFQRKVVSAQQNFYELAMLTPFLFHIIVDKDRTILCPFKLKLISRLSPPLTRKIELDFAEIFQHYLSHELTQDIQPLEQKFKFQEGQICYKVSIQQVQTVKTPSEAKEIHNKLQKAGSIISEAKVDFTELNTEDIVNKQHSKIVNDTNERDSLLLTQRALIDEKDLPKRAKRLKSYHSMSEMTISQIARNLQEQNQKKHIQFQKENQMYQTNRWYLKLGKSRSKHDQQSDSKGLSLTIKMLIFFILLGLSVLFYDVLTSCFVSRTNKDSIKKRLKLRKLGVKKVN